MCYMLGLYIPSLSPIIFGRSKIRAPNHAIISLSNIRTATRNRPFSVLGFWDTHHGTVLRRYLPRLFFGDYQNLDSSCVTILTLCALQVLMYAGMAGMAVGMGLLALSKDTRQPCGEEGCTKIATFGGALPLYLKNAIIARMTAFHCVLYQRLSGTVRRTLLCMSAVAGRLRSVCLTYYCLFF